MQVPPGFFPHAVGSFQSPVVPPLVPPDNPTDLICVQFSRSWLPFVQGALSQLLLQSTWRGTDAIIQNAQINAMLLRYLFSLAETCQPACPVGAGGFELLIRQNASNPCIIESSPDGIHWQEFIDISLCSSPGQPGSGAPQPAPGGGSACYNAAWSASSTWLLPTNVSTGDVIEISHVNGSGSLNGVDYFCVDGRVFSGGTCNGSPTTNPGDAAPALPHMSVILQIAGVYYEVGNGDSITVPGGVTDAVAIMRVNSPSLAGNSGSYTASACVVNNQPASWSAHVDLTVKDGGFVGDTDGANGATTAWQMGIGWVSGNGAAGGFPTEYSLLLHKIFTATHITTVTLTYSLNLTPATVFANHFQTLHGATVIVDVPLAAAAGTQTTGETANATADQILIDLSLNNTPAGTVTLVAIDATGTGTNPF